MDLNTYLMIWVSIIGLCFGSFYNVVILRSLSGESIVFPPSKCPKCNHKLYPWHNIPVLSYIFLRGKCYFCKEKISIQYPLIELITMFLFIFSFWKFGISFDTLFVMLWLSLLLIMSATDLKEQIVDCNLAIIMGVSGLICGYVSDGNKGFISSIMGLLAGVLIFLTITKVGKFIAKKDVMGDADTYVAGALGATFGVYNLPVVLILGIFTYALYFFPVFLYNKFKLKDFPTLITAFLFITSIILFYTVLNNYVGILLLLVSAILFLYFMFKGFNTEQTWALPYVPVFTIGALVFLIFFAKNQLVFNNSILSELIRSYIG